MIRNSLESYHPSRWQAPEKRDRNLNQVQELRTFNDIEQFFRDKAIAYGHGSQDAQRNVARILSTNDSVLFGIKQDGNIVSGAELQLMDRRGTLCGYEWNKFVASVYQGQGLAGLVDSAVYERAREEGCAYLFALVKRGDRRAEASIVRSGFKLNHESSFNDLRSKFPTDDVYVKEL